jgi:hypothetical protein
MIEARELRIGNAVFVGSKLSFANHRLISELASDPEQKMRGSGYKIISILLTEDWLLSLGFTKIVNGWIEFHMEGCGLFLNENFEPCVRVNEDIEVFEIGDQIHYVHQLQNLYHALTGKEFAIQTPTPAFCE